MAKSTAAAGVTAAIVYSQGIFKKLRIFRMLMKNTHQMPGAPGGPEAASAAIAKGSQECGFSTGGVEKYRGSGENAKVSITRTDSGAYRLERENSAAVIVAASLAAVMAAAYGNTG
jgi:hypothetical protein